MEHISRELFNKGSSPRLLEGFFFVEFGLFNVFVLDGAPVSDLGSLPFLVIASVDFLDLDVLSRHLSLPILILKLLNFLVVIELGFAIFPVFPPNRYVPNGDFLIEECD